MKKFLSLVLVIVMVSSLAGCVSLGGVSVEEDNVSSEIAVSSEEKVDNNDGDVLVGTLFTVFSQYDILEHDFGYVDGSLTAERIAEALSALTGLNFEITSQYDAENNILRIDWAPSSSLALGEPADPQLEEFFFYEADSLRWFMLNSLSRTIRENIGEVDIFYTVNGEDLNTLGLSVAVFSSEVDYNQTDNPNVLG